MYSYWMLKMLVHHVASVLWKVKVIVSNAVIWSWNSDKQQEAVVINVHSAESVTESWM